MALGQAQNLVAKIMKEKQVTRTELAARLGKGRSAITRLLSDGRNLTMKSFGRILHALGVEPLFDWAEIKGNNFATELQPYQADVYFLPAQTVDNRPLAGVKMEALESDQRISGNQPDIAA